MLLGRNWRITPAAALPYAATLRRAVLPFAPGAPRFERSDAALPLPYARTLRRLKLRPARGADVREPNAGGEQLRAPAAPLRLVPTRTDRVGGTERTRFEERLCDGPPERSS